jgi:hypothetical protein
MSEVIANGTVAGLIAFLDVMADKGWVSRGAIVALKTAVRQILMAADGDNWEQVEVKSLDIEDYMTRFSNKTMGKYNSQSIAAYRSRLQRAIDWYEKFLANPGWTPKTTPKSTLVGAKDGSAVAEKTRTTTRQIQKGNDNAPQEVSIVENTLSKTTAINLVKYPFPLHSGEVVYFYLPPAFPKLEAERMANFLIALSLE